jgi:hypothetical protein
MIRVSGELRGEAVNKALESLWLVDRVTPWQCMEEGRIGGWGPEKTVKVRQMAGRREERWGVGCHMDEP